MEVDLFPSESSAHTVHDLAQPLNVIRLVTDNIRMRISPHLPDEEALYLIAKCQKIEGQVARATSMLERFHCPSTEISNAENDTCME